MSFRIPFRLMPGSWGLKGDTYLEAEAEYRLTGKALDQRLAEIRSGGDEAELARRLLAIDLKYGVIDQYAYDLGLLGPNPTRQQIADLDYRHGRIDDYQRDMLDAEIENTEGPDRQRAVLKVDLLHGKIGQYEHDRQLVEINTPEGTVREIALLEVEQKHAKLSKHDFDKQRATLNEEPWIGIVDQGFDPDQGVNGVYFEFDWNVFWIDYLRLNGYAGHSEEQIVEMWFQDVCRATADGQPTGQPVTPQGAVRWTGNLLRS